MRAGGGEVPQRGRRAGGPVYGPVSAAAVRDRADETFLDRILSQPIKSRLLRGVLGGV